MLTGICARSESVEDRNVVVQFANQGVRILNPDVLAALTSASIDIARESMRIRSRLSPEQVQRWALPREIATEADVLRRAAGLHQTAVAESALLDALHQRMATATAVGLPTCGGAAPHVLLARAPSA